ncbi:UDP-glucosyltransferase 2 [Pseudolycoriella hygida]|uniref:UDP-glucuronosyltransferase n=1 Tax=Pseudolycoriella hygida TaxID=35572 RepID=A0A9Q0NFV7_9DIPT|nr:UDP-glucosyltransferase 2 [Pseudolycoriella hygida]
MNRLNGIYLLCEVLVIFYLISLINCFKILGVFPCPSRSHYSVGHALMKGLADDGHEVTMVSPFSQTKSIENYTEILLEHSWAGYKRDFMKGNLLEVSGVNFWTSFMNILDYGTKQTGWAVTSENFQQLIQSDQKFDVIIMELIYGEALLGLGYHFRAPVIATSAFGANKWTTDLVGAPIFPSFMPNTNNGFTDRMDFWQRMYNSLSYWFDDIVMPMVSTTIQQKYLDQLFPNTPDMPTITELKRNVSLVLLSTHVTVGTARPYPPNMIEVGGMHIDREIQPLPQHLQQFLDDAEHGVIYLALGSCIQFSKLTNDKKEAIINAFGEFPNMRIIIKNEENIVIPSHQADNVLIEPWFLQQSILAHSAVRVFVTHGGTLSILEAVHFAKPVIGIPIVFDEYLNLAVAQQNDYGISIPFQEITENRLRSALKEILSNSSYAKNAQTISERYRDQLRTPLAIAIHWVKHVAKNKGAPHLRMFAVEMPFYVLYNLD